MNQFALAVGALTLVAGIAAPLLAWRGWPAPGRHRAAASPRARYRAARLVTLTELMEGQ